MIISDSPFIEKLNRLIGDNLGNPAFTVDTICQDLGISRSQLHRTIKEQTDLSISLYIRKRRVCRAKYLLTTTSLRIAEIGDSVGITNPQNFSTYFTEEFQISPTEFRKLYAGSPPAAEILLPPATEALQPAESENLSPPVAAELIPGNPIHPRFSYRRVVVYSTSAIGVLLMVGLGLYAWRQIRPASQASNSLAVLPFTNLGAADSAPACEGIMDDVHRSVSLIENLKVIARSSSDQYKDTPKSIRQIGDELQVNNVLRGSVLKTSDQIQVKVEIIGTQEDIRVWSHTYRAAYKDFFALTDQIVRDVARQLNQKLSRSQTASVNRLLPRNLDAYQEYIKGRQLMLARTGDKLKACIIQFDRAISLDTTFADAYAARSSAYLILGDFCYIDRQAGLKLAEKNALQAIRLDGENGTAYGVLANIYRLQNKWEQALLTFQIALKHSPNDAQINFWYGIALRSIGQFDRAIQYETKAVALNPLYPAALIGLIGTCTNAGRYDLARKAIRDGELLFSDAFMYHYARAFYHVNLREYAQAVAEMRISDSLSNSAKSTRYFRLYLRARVLARNRFEAELQAIHPTPENYCDLATAYAGLEDRENCLKYLQLAADRNATPDYLKVTPLFAFLHNDPRFIRILRQCNLITP